MQSPTVHAQSYGKSDVRVSRITRDGARHSFIDLSVSIALDGDFSASYAAADQSLVVATDTMKNTVYILASRLGVRSMEQFAHSLAKHFVDRYSHVKKAKIDCVEVPWQRMAFADLTHDHAFVNGGCERYTCTCEMDSDGAVAMSSGLFGLQVLKTTGSEFREFYRDEYTTLADADDRVFATAIRANWHCQDVNADWAKARQDIRSVLIDVFANVHSKSVQHTLYEMGKAAFAACLLIDEITIRLPNQHHLLANLTPFGLENPNEVFVPTSAPFGDISATIKRGSESTV
jgi:urate oxidase